MSERTKREPYGPKDQPAIARFWRNTTVSGACVVWKRPGKHGYGLFSQKIAGRHRRMGAHRWLFQQVFGPLPSHVVVMHSCDNRACVTLQHLERGSQKQNVQDAATKGRMPTGETHRNAKLDESTVRLIRELATQGLSQVRIAEKIGRVSATTVQHVLEGKIWRHVK